MKKSGREEDHRCDDAGGVDAPTAHEHQRDETGERGSEVEAQLTRRENISARGGLRCRANQRQHEQHPAQRQRETPLD
ncbi:MAG: hypothetical protein HND48_27035 [Chloroflexi bacterium]|nr:hypothetical protein [Chloroflexota bacterium]